MNSQNKRIPLFVLWPRTDRNGKPILTGIVKRESRAADAVEFAEILKADGAAVRSIRTGGESDWDPEKDVMNVAFQSSYRSVEEFRDKRALYFRNLEEMNSDAAVSWTWTSVELVYAGRGACLVSKEGQETRIEIDWMETTDEAERLGIEKRLNAGFLPAEPFETVEVLEHVEKPSPSPEAKPFEKTSATTELLRDAAGNRYICVRKLDRTAGDGDAPVELRREVFWRVLDRDSGEAVTKDNWKEHVWDGGEL